MQWAKQGNKIVELKQIVGCFGETLIHPASYTETIIYITVT
jgi:hypothetical protein